MHLYYDPHLTLSEIEKNNTTIGKKERDPFKTEVNWLLAKQVKTRYIITRRKKRNKIN